MTSNTQQVPYDFTFIERQRMNKPKTSWRTIATHYDRDVSNVYRWFQKEINSRSKSRKRTPRKTTTITTKRGSYYTPSRSTNVKGEVPRVYGVLPPTNYISDLSNDEWIIKYCGQGYEWNIQYLTEMRDILWQESNTVICLPRFTGKTKSEEGLYLRWILEKQVPIMSITSGGSSKRRVYNAVKRLLRTEIIRKTYGDIIESFSSHMGEMWLVSELNKGYSDPVFKVVGRLGDVIGAHPVKLILSDIVQEDMKSSESQEALFDWFDTVVAYTTDSIVAVGTRRSSTDFYTHLFRKGFKLHHKKAITLINGDWSSYKDCEIEEVRDGENVYDTIVDITIHGEFELLPCPNLSVKSLMIDRILNYESFQSQRQNEPVAKTGNYFSIKHWVEIDDPTDFYNKYIIVDPAFGESNAASETSILVLGIQKGKMLIVDSAIGKLDLVQKSFEIIRLHELYEPLQTIIEDNFRQMTTRYTRSSPLMRLRGIRVINQFKDKIQRISALKAPYERMDMQILKTCSNKGKIRNQYLEFNQKKKSWDILDALATGYELLSPFMRRLSKGTKIGAYRGAIR